MKPKDEPFFVSKEHPVSFGLVNRPTTAHEWWLQERENQLDLAKFMYEKVGDCTSMWQHLFAWATPDIWHDPVPIVKEKNND